MQNKGMLDETDGDPETTLSYLDQRLLSVLGDVHKELRAGMTTMTLHSKYGYFGSFLPAYEWRQSALIQDKLLTLAASNMPNERKYSVEGSIELDMLRGRQEATSYFAEHTPKTCSKDLVHELQYVQKSKNNPLSFPDDISHQPNADTRPRNNSIYSAFGLGDFSSSSGTEEDDENDQQSDVEMEYSSDRTPLTMIQIMTSHRPPNGLLLSPLKNLIVDPNLNKKLISSMSSGERTDHDRISKVDKSEEKHKGEGWRETFLENVSKWKENTTKGPLLDVPKLQDDDRKGGLKEYGWHASKPSLRCFQVDEGTMELSKGADDGLKMIGIPLKIKEGITEDKLIRKFSVKMEPKVIEEKPINNLLMRKEQRIIEAIPQIKKEERVSEEKHIRMRKEERVSEEKRIRMEKEERISQEKHLQMKKEDKEINCSIKMERVTDEKHAKGLMKVEESAVGGRPKPLKAHVSGKSALDLPKDGLKVYGAAKHGKEDLGSLPRKLTKEDLISMPKSTKDELVSVPKSGKEVSSMFKTLRGKEELDSIPKHIKEDLGIKPKPPKGGLDPMCKHVKEDMRKYGKEGKEDIASMPRPGKEDFGLMHRIDLKPTKVTSIPCDSRNEALEGPKVSKKQSVSVREDDKKHKSAGKIHSSSKGLKFSINERARHDKRPFEADDMEHADEAVQVKTQKIIVRQKELPPDGKDSLKLVTKSSGQGVILPSSSVPDRDHHVFSQDYHYTDRVHHASDHDYQIKEGKKTRKKSDKISKENIFLKGSNKERLERGPDKASVSVSNIQSAGMGTFAASTIVPIAPFTFIEVWVACDECNKWRLLPPGMHVSEASAWNCTMLYWLEHPVDCSVPEEVTTHETQARYYVKVPQPTQGQPPVNTSITDVHINSL